MSRENLVHRLIAFFKRPDALDHRSREPVRNAYDDYAPRETPPRVRFMSQPSMRSNAPFPKNTGSMSRLCTAWAVALCSSRLDALVMRAAQQFNARLGLWCTDRNGRMRYCRAHHAGAPSPWRRAEPPRHLAGVDSGGRSLSSCRRATVSRAVRVLDDGRSSALYPRQPGAQSPAPRYFDVFCDQAPACYAMVRKQRTACPRMPGRRRLARFAPRLAWPGATPPDRWPVRVHRAGRAGAADRVFPRALAPSGSSGRARGPARACWWMGLFWRSDRGARCMSGRGWRGPRGCRARDRCTAARRSTSTSRPRNGILDVHA